MSQSSPAQIQSESQAKSKFHFLRLAIVLGTAVFLFWACFTNRFSLNDQKYMVWSPRHVPSLRVYLGAFLFGIPFFVGQWVYIRRPRALILPLGLLMLSTFAAMVGFLCLSWTHPTLDAIPWTTRNQANGGYFSEGTLFADSGATVNEILQNYPQILTRLLGHGFNKPPGLPLFCMGVAKLFGAENSGADVTAMMAGIGATLSVLATYLFIRYFSENRDAAFFGASFVALCPSIVLFFPEWDGVYPIFTAALTIAWASALQKKSKSLAGLFGLLLAFTAFITYLPLALAIFLAGYTLYKLRTDPNCRVADIVKYIAIALAGFAGFYLLLWLITGFDPIATFASAWHEEHLRMYRWTLLAKMPPRKLPGTIPWDLYSFALGTSWISFILAGFYFYTATQNRSARRELPIALLCVAQFMVVTMTGLIRGETLRLWAFMLPMLMLPIGLELARWNILSRMLVYVALLALTAAIYQSMLFIV